MSQTAHRNGRCFFEKMNDREAWGSASPQQEARSCLQIARSNGGVEHMRELITISPGETAELLAWATEEPKLSARIVKAIGFREAVLQEFNHLAAGMPAERSGSDLSPLRHSPAIEELTPK